jgi:phosphoserine phosphatase RsbU/P
VTGKGPEAAAVTATARHTARAVAMYVRRPCRILAAVNEALLRMDVPDRWCTVGCVQLRPEEGGFRAVVACGGHPLPLLLRAGGEVREIGEPGLLLGAIPEDDFPEREERLAPGDTLVLFTDGVPEARWEGELFGDERLAELLASCAEMGPEQIVERIERTVVEFQHGVPRDDIALLAVRVRGLTRLPAPAADAPPPGPALREG